MHNVNIIFERLEGDNVEVSIDSKIIIFNFKKQTHCMAPGNSLTLTLDIPETLAEILEAKICRSARI